MTSTHAAHMSLDEVDRRAAVAVTCAVVQTGPPTASIAIPLSTAWTACERYLSGSFRLTGAALCAEVELAWARCRGDPPLSVSPSRKRVSVAAPYSESGTLHVLLASARGLRAADSNGSSDPYTVLKVHPPNPLPPKDDSYSGNVQLGHSRVTKRIGCFVPSSRYIESGKMTLRHSAAVPLAGSPKPSMQLGPI